MNIEWRNERLKTKLEDIKYLRKTYGPKAAVKIVQRLQELRNAPSYVHIPRAAHPHLLNPNSAERFTVDIPSRGGGRGKLRLVFIPNGEYEMSNLSTIKSIIITEITDPH